MAGLAPDYDHAHFQEDRPEPNNPWAPGNAPGPYADQAALAWGHPRRGICDTAEVFGAIYESNPLISANFCRNSQLDHLADDHGIDSFKPISFLTRCYAAYLDQTDDDAIQTGIMFQAMAPYLPDGVILNQAACVDVLIKASVAFLANKGGCLALVAPAARDHWADAIAAGGDLEGFVYNGAPVDAIPLPTASADLLTAGNAHLLVNWICDNQMVNTWKDDTRGLFTALLIALAKRGNVTQVKSRAIMQEVRSQFGFHMPTGTNLFRLLGSVCGKYVTAENVRPLFRSWEEILPAAALRVRLTIMQAAGSGLTTISVISKAVRLYPDFYWGRVHKMFSEEMNSVGQALALIRNNPYYGFNQDLGVAKATNFKNVGWIAKELLVRINGDGSLRDYAGWPSTPKYKAILETMINAYVANKMDRVNEEPDPENTQMASDIIRMVNDSNAIGI